MNNLVCLSFQKQASTSLDWRECVFVILIGDFRVLSQQPCGGRLTICQMLFASLLSVIQRNVGCMVKGHHGKFPIHPKHTVRGSNAGCPNHQGYGKAGLDTKRTVTWKICFCRGLDRPLFRTLTPQSCLLRYWQCRYHFSGICSCSRLRLKEKQQNHLRLIWNLFELISAIPGMWRVGVGVAYWDRPFNVCAGYNKHGCELSHAFWQGWLTTIWQGKYS